jgi:hypothetical protein
MEFLLGRSLKCEWKFEQVVAAWKQVYGWNSNVNGTARNGIKLIRNAKYQKWNYYSDGVKNRLNYLGFIKILGKPTNYTINAT